MDQYEDSFDDILAKMEMPEDPKFEHQLAEGSSKTENFKEPEPNKTKYANAIQVNPKQRGNPILKSITNIPYEFNDQILADYIVGKTAAVLYLSVRYHNLKPDYIHERLKQLGKNYELRVLLVHVDVKESQNALKHLTRVCLLANLTLMLAWSSEEAGKIIETYKMFENRPPDFIMEKVESDKYHSIVSGLTSIRAVNKTDAMTLLANFGTLGNLIVASENKLSALSGLGVRKAQKILQIFNEPFLK